MSVSKRKHSSGRVNWEVRYRDGSRHRSKTFASRNDANSFEAQVRLATRTETLHVLDGGRIDLSDFGEKWWAEYVKPRLETATRHGYSHAWNTHVLPYLGDHRLRDISPRAIEHWRGQLERDGVGAPTVRKSMVILQSCLQRAVVWGEIPANPCREVKKPAGKRKREIRPLTPIQIETMRADLTAQGKHRDATLVSVMAYAGLRPSEALALEWEHVRKKSILVEQSVSFGEMKETKTGKTRAVPICTQLAKDLQAWRLRCGEREGLVFPAADGKPWSREAQKSWQRRTFKAAAKVAGRTDAGPYTLRHSFASLLIHEGRSVVEVAAQLGHAPTMTLDTYAHVFAELDERSSADDLIVKARRDVRKKYAAAR